MNNFIHAFDTNIYSFIISFKSQILDLFMLFITNFASAFTLIALALLSFIVIKNKKNSINITLNLIIVFIVNRLLKIVIARPRPIEELHMVTETGYSFPSAHSMIGAAFYGYIIYLINKNIKNTKAKIILTIALSLLVILIGISRIYLGVHYPTDVIGGILFAIIYLFIYIKLSERKKRNEC